MRRPSLTNKLDYRKPATNFGGLLRWISGNFRHKVNADRTILDVQVPKLISPDALVSKKAKLESPVRVFAFAGIEGNATIGRYTSINRHAFISAGAKVGRYCSISRAVEIGTADHLLHLLSTHSFQFDKRHFESVPGYKSFPRHFSVEPDETILGHDVAVGAKAMVKAGVTIGTGAVIRAGSFVTSDVPPYAIVVGTPAKIIRYRFVDKTIEKLLRSKWWDLLPEEMQDVTFDNIDLALDQIEEIHALKAKELAAKTSPKTEPKVSDDPVVQGLQQSLFEMDMPDNVVALVMSNAPAIAKTYDPLNAGDQQILNNKLAYLVDFMLERDPSALTLNEQNHIRNLFRQKA